MVSCYQTDIVFTCLKVDYFPPQSEWVVNLPFSEMAYQKNMTVPLYCTKILSS